jgi:hypothetical protein
MITAARMASSFTTSLIILTVLSLSAASAQSSCPKTEPYALLRQDDDYSFLRNPACQQDFWDPIKFIRLNRDGDKYVTLGGEIREWYEGFHNANWGAGAQDGNGYLLQRISLFSDFHLDERVPFFAQLTSDIEAGRNGGPRPVDEARLWLEQGFADIRLKASHDTSLSLRVGRQEFEFGSGRLVDAREGPNVRLAFDGVAMVLKTATWNVDGFATRPVINNMKVFDDPPNHATMFWGVYAVRPLHVTRGGNIDLYYLGIDNKQATFNRGTAKEVRHTIGTRFWGTRGSWNYDWEAMLQGGSFGNAGIRAWAIGTDTAYSFRSLPLTPQFGIRLATTSGDRNSKSGDLGTFNPLFPTGIYFGQGAIALNGPSNLNVAGASVKLHLTGKVLLAGDYDFFWRESVQDGVYGLGVNLLRSGLENQDRYIGSQPSAGIYWTASRHLGVSAAYAHFAVGPFLTHGTSPGRSVGYAAIWMAYKF